MLKLIDIKYKVELNQLEPFVDAHRTHLQCFYDQGYLLASGPKNPRTGGIILAIGEVAVLQRMIETDPFYINDLADFNIVSFEPVKKSKQFAELIESMQANLMSS